jgi:uncharacterized protein YbjT (DUF2867 family)
MEGRTMQARQKIAVTGATGRLGPHVVAVLEEAGHEVVAISRSNGIDVITREGLDAALTGVDVVIDAATGASPDRDAATEFFTTAADNVQDAAQRAGVRRIAVVSIIGIDRFAGGYNAAKVAHEQALLAGPVPVRILRAAQFHELVAQMMAWGTQGDVCYVPEMRAQPVAARTAAEELVRVALADEVPAMSELAGPREESMVALAGLLAARRGEGVRVQGVTDPDDPDSRLNTDGALLPGPDARLAGPTFESWLEATIPAAR